jgi:predicted metal-dependent HD superfamily phosphohydrolase
MMLGMNKLLSDTEKYVTGLFLKNNDDKLRYHNIVHTKSVVKAAELIAGKCAHHDGDIEALLVAAWFHDVGYLKTKVEHEEVSKRYARNYLEGKGADEAFIHQVERAIEATKLPQNPQDRLSAALCDADLYHVSQDDFMENTQIFWDELAAMNGEDMDEFKYLGTTLNFLNAHKFQTEYGQTILEPGKQANLKKVRKALEKYNDKIN